MNIKDWLEMEFASLLERFHHHPDVQAAIVAAQTPVVVAPTPVVAPVAPVVVPPAPPVLVPVVEPAPVVAVVDDFDQPLPGPTILSFDSLTAGVESFVKFPANVPVSFAVNVDSPFTLRWYEIAYGHPCQMAVTVNQPATSNSGAGNGGEAVVQAGPAVVTLTSPINTRWAIAVKP